MKTVIKIKRGGQHIEQITVLNPDGTPRDLTGAKLWWVARETFDSADVVFELTSDPDGGIEITSAVGGLAFATITPVQSIAWFDDLNRLTFTLWVLEADGTLTPGESGLIEIVPTVPRTDGELPWVPVNPINGVFAQVRNGVSVWSSWTLPLLAEAADFGKVLSVTAEGVASWVALTGSGGPEVDPRLPAHGTSGNFLRSTGSEWASVAVTLANLPADPADNNKLAIGSSGNLAYLASTAADRFLRGNGSGGWSESAYALPASIGTNTHVLTVVAGVLAFAALPAGLTAPTDPDHNSRPAIGSAGNLTYPSGNHFTGGADGSDGLDTRITAKVETTNATPLAVVTLTPPANAVLGVEVHALVHQAATGDTCRRKRSATWRVDSGTVTRVGAATVDGDGGDEEDAGAATWDVTITTSGGDIIVSVVGEAAHTLTWQTFVQFERLDI